MRTDATGAPETLWPAPGTDAWVFAYGSLMWNPGFPVAERRPALLRGYHRSLCILSIRNRGTVDRPGLALGLDRGGSCRGYALRIAAEHAASTWSDLWEREMVNAVYLPKSLPVRLDGGEAQTALVFVARPDHPQYVHGLSVEAVAALVAQGEGLRGTALDYLDCTVRQLDAFGICDGPLHRILDLAVALKGDSAAPASG